MTEPLLPARIDFSDASAPRAIDFDDIYHARGGALEQARHVFLAGNGLPQRWSGRDHFVLLETGFGLGHSFLATWAAWRDHGARCAHLWFLSVDKHPPRPDDLRRAHAHGAEPDLARELIAAWPPLTPDMHRRDFAQGRVHLLLAFGDLARWLPQWVASVDAFYLDGFAPAKNPAMWEPRVLQRLGRLAAPGATAATWSTARVVRDALAAADFSVQRQGGFDHKREMLTATHAPRHRAPMPAGRRHGGATDPVAIIGAGLAGAACAQALARLGMRSRVIDAHPAAAEGGSGQPAGLLHGVVHHEDSPHTRWFRAGAMHAYTTIAPMVASGAVRGALDGLLRVERQLDRGAMQRMLDAQALPASYVQALSAVDASALAGCAVNGPAWRYTGGGWVDPRSLVRHWLDHELVEWMPRTRVTRIARGADGRWRLFDVDDRVVCETETLVLANADGLQPLLAEPRWPLQRSRGQVTWIADAPSNWRPAVPIAGAGYAISLDGGLLCGATSDLDDGCAEPREADHRRNLDGLQRLSGRSWDPTPESLEGRVAWRVHTRDRLPLLGGVPLPPAARASSSRQDQPRFIARVAGLHVLAALGSRGLTQAPLAGDVLAAMLTGTPLPIGSALLDAVDAARFAARDARDSAQ
ncbi:MAG TPA: FAD-dependent 5-carboxymethylaminomethyl-2-thiouridine(34) oxidoreductase MnmC [Burkholderiaceae bacterium]|nr:FAD-dependent 5-carboxymethylaminomethyl-2-thiouridine(34) oxidoreductase MnmC [Burkholderiaceae bacterium]